MSSSPARHALDTANLIAQPAPHCCHGLPANMGIGLVIVVIMAVAQTASSELTGAGLASLKAPFFTMWLHTAFMIFVMPVTAACEAVGLLTAKGPGWRTSIQANLWDGAAPTIGRWCWLPPLVQHAAGLYVLWVAANYAYAGGLVFASASLVTAVFSSCSAFVALLSRVWLKERMTLGKVASVVLAVGGVLVLGLTTHSKGQGLNPALGVMFGLVSSISAAVYKVAFKVA